MAVVEVYSAVLVVLWLWKVIPQHEIMWWLWRVILQYEWCGGCGGLYCSMSVVVVMDSYTAV